MTNAQVQQNIVTSEAQYLREDNGSFFVYPILADGSVGKFDQRIGYFKTPQGVGKEAGQAYCDTLKGSLVENVIYTFTYSEKPAPSGAGNYRDLIEVSVALVHEVGDIEEQVRPAPAPARAQSYAPAAGQSLMTFKDQLIVDQVILKASIDLQVSGATVEKATSQAIKAWELIRARHDEPVKPGPIETTKDEDDSLGVLRAE